MFALQASVLCVGAHLDFYKFKAYFRLEERESKYGFSPTPQIR